MLCIFLKLLKNLNNILREKNSLKVTFIFSKNLPDIKTMKIHIKSHRKVTKGLFLLMFKSFDIIKTLYLDILKVEDVRIS